MEYACCLETVNVDVTEKNLELPHSTNCLFIANFLLMFRLFPDLFELEFCFVYQNWDYRKLYEVQLSEFIMTRYKNKHVLKHVFRIDVGCCSFD